MPASPTSERPGSMMISEMPGDRCHHRPGVTVDRGHVAAIMCRKSTADIDHSQLYIRLREQRKHARGAADRAVPLPEIGLLRADMERDAVGVEAKVASVAQQFDSHLGSAAEFAR